MQIRLLISDRRKGGGINGKVQGMAIPIDRRRLGMDKRRHDRGYRVNSNKYCDLCHNCPFILKVISVVTMETRIGRRRFLRRKIVAD